MNTKRSFIFRLLWSNLARKFYLWFLALIALFSVMNWIVMPWYVNDGGTVTVPNLVGMQAANAKQILDTLGLQFEIGGNKSSKLKPNTILSQNPDGGTIVKHGRRIYFILSGGVEKVTVPNLSGHSQREAQFMLERSGFILGKVTYDSSNNFPQNVVMSQSLVANTLAPSGSAISIVVSAGAPTAGEVSVPNLVGLPLADAQRAILNGGLLLGDITFQPSRRLVPNTVVEQYPRAQEIVPKGTKINLFVSSIENQQQGPEQ